MYKLPVSIQCLRCKSSIPLDRLDNHLKKAHRLNKKARVLEIDKHAYILTAKQEFEKINQLVESHLKEKGVALQSSSDIKTLSIMAIETLLGYESAEAIAIGCVDDHRTHVSSSNRLWPTFQPLLSSLYDLLTTYRKPGNIDSSVLLEKTKERKKGNRKKADDVDYYTEEDDCSSYMSWYDCNSVDPADASKYMGYYQREYGGSRFGSFPVHDDYGEDSWADADPWE